MILPESIIKKSRKLFIGVMDECMIFLRNNKQKKMFSS